tara:strand:- start:41 stop:457 length:417 start_codon:yes stop_codon:yes gene_type:complete
MVYLVELSVNLHNSVNLSNIQRLLVKKAENCGMETYYKTYEFMGNNRNIYRNHCIISFTFADNKQSIVLFIKYVKTLSNVYIESVGYDNFTFKLMYASKKYLNIMEKGLAKTYLEEKKKGELYEQDSIISQILLKGKK